VKVLRIAGKIAEPLKGEPVSTYTGNVYTPPRPTQPSNVNISDVDRVREGMGLIPHERYVEFMDSIAIAVKKGLRPQTRVKKLIGYGGDQDYGILVGWALPGSAVNAQADHGFVANVALFKNAQERSDDMRSPVYFKLVEIEAAPKFPPILVD
jgi:hypothetical protein